MTAVCVYNQNISRETMTITLCSWRFSQNEVSTRASQKMLGYLPHSAFHTEWSGPLVVTVLEVQRVPDLQTRQVTNSIPLFSKTIWR